MSFFEKLQKITFGHFHLADPWDLAANFYDLSQPTGFWILGATTPLSYSEFARKIVSSLNLPNKPNVIDCACGTGFLHEAISDHISEGGQCIAVDFSPQMLKKAYQKYQKRRTGRFFFRQFNVYALSESLPLNSFDGAFLSFTLPVLEDPQKALCNIYQLLKPGAGISIATLSREVMDAQKKAYLWRLLVRFYQRRYLYQHELTDALTAVGFSRITFKSIGWTLIITAYRPED